MLDYKPTIYYGKSAHINWSNLSQRNRVSTPAAKLWFVFFRINFELIQMILGGEIINGVFVIVLEPRISLHGFVVGKKGYCVVSINNYSLVINIIKVLALVFLRVCGVHCLHKGKKEKKQLW